jgi:CubicO group peptidase (beta-lactamase class C family)
MGLESRSRAELNVNGVRQGDEPALTVKLALAAELYTPPGAAFTYNNKSVNLLSGIIHIATGQPLDDYVRDHFFKPMGIKSWQWTRDDAGNPYAMADLALYPEDFAKFGTLMLQKGQWNGKQLVPMVCNPNPTSPTTAYCGGGRPLRPQEWSPQSAWPKSQLAEPAPRSSSSSQPSKINPCTA